MTVSPEAFAIDHKVPRPGYNPMYEGPLVASYGSYFEAARDQVPAEETDLTAIWADSLWLRPGDRVTGGSRVANDRESRVRVLRIQGAGETEPHYSLVSRYNSGKYVVTRITMTSMFTYNSVTGNPDLIRPVAEGGPPPSELSPVSDHATVVFAANSLRRLFQGQGPSRPGR